jgi:hypothetical protein
MEIDEQKVEEAVGKVFGRVGYATSTEAGYPNVRRVAQQAAPFNIVLEARP